jgi:hypothetical protein
MSDRVEVMKSDKSRLMVMKSTSSFAIHAEVGNLFRIRRHLMKAHYYREYRSRSYSEWQQLAFAK